MVLSFARAATDESAAAREVADEIAGWADAQADD